MAFAELFNESIYPEWRFYYVDYERLRDMIAILSEAGSDEANEARFLETIESEMQKAFDFKEVKFGELTRHVQHCENVVSGVQNSSDDAEVSRLIDEIERIRIELARLATFSRINYNAIQKILSKHDKNTDYMLKPMFTLRLSDKYASLENLDNLVYRLSKLYDKLRRGPNAPAEVKETNQFFIRKTTKYWVHPDNVAEVKCAILKYLPVLVYPSDTRTLDPAVSSVYFDNDALDLYKGRLEKTEGAEAIRLRWYGKSESPSEIFVERKLHREDWTGEISIKARFPLKEKHVNDFIDGKYTPAELIKKLEKTNKYTPDDLSKIEELAKEIQRTIHDKALKPKLRTFYNRIAFQLPGDARVRISLDTDLCMIREDGPQRAGSNWRRTDVRTEVPYRGLPKRDFERFPYSVLEVKLQTLEGQEPPQWVKKLVEGHLVEAVPKFSKYIHGCAMLFPQKVALLPYWHDQMNVDIRKEPNFEKIEDAIQRQQSYTSNAGFDEHFEEDEEADSMTPTVNASKEQLSHVVIPIKDSAETTPLLAGDEAGPSRTRKPSVVAEAQEKKIFVPVRVEPKVFFANERTFLSWIHFSIFLGGISTALVGLGNRTARLSGYMFGGVSILFTVYALYLYMWRARRIRARDPGPYDDLVGPWLVVVVFLLAMVANIAMSGLSQN